VTAFLLATEVAPMMFGMEGIRFRRPTWTVYRIWTDEDGIDDAIKDMGLFWGEENAVEEAARLNEANEDPDIRFEVIEHVTTGIYPADESPPWVPDPERLARRGYESRDPHK
jgi:hypothetical protein